MREQHTTEEGKIVRVHDNKVCHECGLTFKRASGKRAHDQNYHGINTGMMAGSPRQRKFILDLEYTQLLEKIIEKKVLDMKSIYSSTKLPSNAVTRLVQQLVDSGVVYIDENNNVSGSSTANKLVRLA